MIDTELKEIGIGGAVFVGLLLALGYSYGKTDSSLTGGYTVNATFNRVDGLSPGDDVQLAGIKVGSVTSMDLDENYRPVLTLHISEGIKMPTDTAVAIHTTGLFGSKYVVLDPGGSDDELKPGDRISYTQDAVLVDELLELIIAQGKANRIKRAESEPANGGK